MIKILTYQNLNGEIGDHAFLAYIVLANGRFDCVRFNGATEEIARARALAFAEKEQKEDSEQSILLPGTWTWMRDSENKLAKVLKDEVDKYIANGYRLSGPRSQ